MSKIRYDDLGQRVTDCCGTYSTYHEGPDGLTYLVCKRCYASVEIGEGDGNEFREGVNPDEYYKAQGERDRKQTKKWLTETRKETS